jgi:hypothetical protein
MQGLNEILLTKDQLKLQLRELSYSKDLWFSKLICNDCNCVNCPYEPYTDETYGCQEWLLRLVGEEGYGLLGNGNFIRKAIIKYIVRRFLKKWALVDIK